MESRTETPRVSKASVTVLEVEIMFRLSLIALDVMSSMLVSIRSPAYCIFCSSAVVKPDCLARVFRSSAVVTAL